MAPDRIPVDKMAAIGLWRCRHWRRETRVAHRYINQATVGANKPISSRLEGRPLDPAQFHRLIALRTNWASVLAYRELNYVRSVHGNFSEAQRSAAAGVPKTFAMSDA